MKQIKNIKPQVVSVLIAIAFLQLALGVLFAYVGAQ